MRSPGQGADTVVWLASSPEVEDITGRYSWRRQEKRSSGRSYDIELARRLWRISEELTGLRQPA
jgi:retinol dehydrogenase 14